MARRWWWQVAVAGVIFVVCVAIGVATGPVLRAALQFIAAPFTPAAAPGGVPLPFDDGGPEPASSARVDVRPSWRP